MLVGAITNKSALLILMVVLIVFVVLITALAIVFITVLRKRQPVVKVVMAQPNGEQPENPAALPAPESAAAPALQAGEQSTQLALDAAHSESADTPALSESAPAAAAADEDKVVYVKEGTETVRYDRSFTAKIIQLKDASKEWYSDIKNELLSYGKVKERISWKRETFKNGRETVARFLVRGKTLCVLLATDPAQAESKYGVQDVSAVSTTADTPSQIRLTSDRRCKYAMELIAKCMSEHGLVKQEREAIDYFLPYDGTVGLMKRGLIKRVIAGSTRVLKIEEVDKAEAEAAAAAQGDTEPVNPPKKPPFFKK